MAGIANSMRDRVLDLWAQGFTGAEIAAKLAAGTRFDVSAIVRAARDAGDPRAVTHFGKGMSSLTVAVSEMFSRAQYLRMDAAFKVRLTRAIRRRKERAPVGIYRSRMPARSVPLRLQPESSLSITGSSAGECADIGAATASD